VTVAPPGRSGQRHVRHCPRTATGAKSNARAGPCAASVPRRAFERSRAFGSLCFRLGSAADAQQSAGPYGL